ncbi:beta-glucosidase [Actinomadura scrupuli]|uniref:beta-glucosidase family protein n=1 Tax=Actinomadura scrupuli TaxID=559629 RepID=UPI003D95B2E6
MLTRRSVVLAALLCIAPLAIQTGVGTAAPLPRSVAATAARAAAPCGDPASRPWCATGLSPDQRAGLLLAAMTLGEELDLMAGDDLFGPLHTPDSPTAHEGTVNGIPRLGIPTVLMAGGGPAGIRQGPGTALPAPIALGAGFDVAAAARFASVVGDEARRKGNDVALGPAVDIVRVPQAGRAYEAFGEDPYLATGLTVPWVRAAQAQGVIAAVKHYPANNQERDRYLGNIAVSARTLREIYLPAFEAAVRNGRAGMVMCGYNRVNGEPSCGSKLMLDQVLRDQWGFRGTVISDWVLAAKGTAVSANGGLDIEMPIGLGYTPLALRAALGLGTVSRATVDAHVRNYLRTLFAHGVFDRPQYPNAPETIDTAGHADTARQIAENGITLLKNNGVLPLGAPRKIAVIGSAADSYVSGGGSSQVTPRAPVTPRQGITARAGSGATVTYSDGSDPAAAAELARSSDVAIVVAAASRQEATDLSCLSLECGTQKRGDQDGLIAKVAAANPRTVVVLETGGPVLTPWAGQVAAVVEAWYPGEQGGTALARVLYGDVDPGGRLPVTFPAAEGDTPVAGDPRRYPGVDGTATYSEGVMVGYRHYDANGITPSFPFGFGLSYTTFGYGDLAVRPGGVSVTVTNTGQRTGTAVPQLYLGMPAPDAGTPQPPRALKGFAKVVLAPGQSRRVTFPLNARSYAFWHQATGSWKIAPGCYRVMVGASSRDIAATGGIPRGGGHC